MYSEAGRNDKTVRKDFEPQVNESLPQLESENGHELEESKDKAITE